jgi:SAM-dependent methyltransferase
MPFTIDELYRAHLKYNEFKRNNQYSNHERFIFPLLCGTYFGYRRVDVMRLVAIAKSISPKPTYLDVGCGYGDFLEKIREFIPTASGIERDGNIFYLFQREKPDYIRICDIASLEGQFDIIFVGWMDPGTDFRKYVAKQTNCIVTTFDEGGQCGLNGACDYEEYGFKKIAYWFTPSWIDVNYELMNRYYTSIDSNTKNELFKLRSTHNVWHIYARNEISKRVYEGLRSWITFEHKLSLNKEGRYDFESVLDECGFGYYENISKTICKKILWKISFD